MYLLDTNVVSELRRARPHGAVMAWLAAVRPAKLCLSVVTLGEIQMGIERARFHDAEKARAIEAWADQAINAFEILPIDAAIIREWARLRRGKPDDNFEDTILAVTAMAHGLTLVTRNLRDFVGLGVETIDPFMYQPR
jgi:predicted nucleic acid-binding protein